MRIQDKLLQLRTEHGLTIRELALELGIPHSNYARVERQQVPSIKLLFALERFYGIRLEQILKDVTGYI